MNSDDTGLEFWKYELFWSQWGNAIFVFLVEEIDDFIDIDLT